MMMAMIRWDFNWPKPGWLEDRMIKEQGSGHLSCTTLAGTIEPYYTRNQSDNSVMVTQGRWKIIPIGDDIASRLAFAAALALVSEDQPVLHRKLCKNLDSKPIHGLPNPQHTASSSV